MKKTTTRVSVTIEFETEKPLKLASAFQRKKIDKNVLGTIISAIKKDDLFFTRYYASGGFRGFISKEISFNISDIKPKEK